MSNLRLKCAIFIFLIGMECFGFLLEKNLNIDIITNKSLENRKKSIINNEKNRSPSNSGELIYNNIETILNDKLEQYNSFNYFSQIYQPSLQAIYYSVDILNALGKLDTINQTSLIEAIMTYYNPNFSFFIDDYARRYLNIDFIFDYYPLTTLLEVNCYAILSLEILGALDLINSQNFTNFIWSCYNPLTSGFIGQPYSSNLHENFKTSTLDNTFYAIITINKLSSWSYYQSKKNELVNYINNLQYYGLWPDHVGGFLNDNNDNFKSLYTNYPNLLSCYFAIKSLKIFDLIDTINIDKFYQYLSGLYDNEKKFFKFAADFPSNNNTNLAASAIGLELSILTQFTEIDQNGIENFLLRNRNSYGIWNCSTEIKNRELIDTFEVIRSLKDLNLLSIFTETDKILISETLNIYYSQYKGFSLISKDFISLNLIYSLVNSFDLNNRLSDLPLNYLYQCVTNSSFYYLPSKYLELYSCSYLDKNYRTFRSSPLEYYDRNNRINMIDFKTTFYALDFLEKTNKLTNFSNIYNLTELFIRILNSQYLNLNYINYGGFLPSYTPTYSSDIKNLSVLIDFSYYAIRSLQILARFLNLGSISDHILNTSALITYFNNKVIEKDNILYCYDRSASKIEDILEKMYFLIYSLITINYYQLNSTKIKNYIIQIIDYSNIKNVYYSYKIAKTLGIDINLKFDLVFDLIQNIYSENYKEYYLSLEKKTLFHEVLMWVSEIYSYDLKYAALKINIIHLENCRFLSTENYLEFNINSSYSGTYEIWINNNYEENNFFQYGQTEHTYSLDKFTNVLGDYSVKINATSRGGQYCEVSVTFTVYSDSSTIVNLLKLNNYKFMSIRNNISFQIFSDYPDEYNFSIDGNEMSSGQYYNGQIFNFSIDGFRVGIHNVSIKASSLDNKSGIIQSSFLVFSDSETRIVINHINNYIFNSEGNELNFTIFSEYPDTYAIKIDNILVELDIYSNGVPIIYLLDGFSIGIHNILIWANSSDFKETSYNLQFQVFSESFIYIDVIDLPNYEFKTIGHQALIKINASFPEYFKIYIDSLLKFEGIYEFGGFIVSFSIDGYTVGEHEVLIWANDSLSKSAEYSSSFSIYSLSNTIVEIVDLYDYKFMTVGNFINFKIYSDYPDFFKLYIDDIEILADNFINGEIININIDGYYVGLHTVYIWAIGEDYKVGTALNEFIVYSNSSTIIIINKIPNYKFMTLENYINFSISSEYNGTFSVSIDDNIIQEGNYFPMNYVIIPIDGYCVGTHSVFIFAHCIDSKEAFYGTIFEVYTNSTTLIQINSLQGFEFMSEENSLNFSVYSEYPDYYELWIDGIFIKLDNFLNGLPILFSLDNYSEILGEHSVYIWATGKDFRSYSVQAGFSVFSNSTTIINVNILDNFEFMSRQNNFTFTIFSKYPDYYNLSIDRILIESRNYTNGIAILHSLDNYTYLIGFHNISIYAIGKDGKIGYSISSFEVISLSITHIEINRIDDYLINSIGNYLSFSIASKFPDIFSLFIDDILINSSMYFDNQHFNFSIDNYDVGIHNILIWAIGLDKKEDRINVKFEVFSNISNIINIIYSNKDNEKKINNTKKSQDNYVLLLNAFLFGGIFFSLSYVYLIKSKKKRISQQRLKIEEQIEKKVIKKDPSKMIYDDTKQGSIITIKEKKYKLIDISGIGLAKEKKLNCAGIYNIEDLLNCDAEMIAKQVSGLGEVSINKWKEIAKQITI